MSASTASTAMPAHGAYQRLAGWHGELTAFRRDLHAHPHPRGPRRPAPAPAVMAG